MKEKRKTWKENMFEYNPEKLVFLEESGVNINMTRFYVRSKGSFSRRRGFNISICRHTAQT